MLPSTSTLNRNGNTHLAALIDSLISESGEVRGDQPHESIDRMPGSLNHVGGQPVKVLEEHASHLTHFPCPLIQLRNLVLRQPTECHATSSWLSAVNRREGRSHDMKGGTDLAKVSVVRSASRWASKQLRSARRTFVNPFASCSYSRPGDTDDMLSYRGLLFMRFLWIGLNLPPGTHQLLARSRS